MSELIAQEQGSIKISSFWLSGRLFGVEITDVREVNRELDYTPIFHAPEEVKGYVNIRGLIHLILDLRLIMGFESKPVDSQNKLVIFKASMAEPFGVLVDSVGDIIEVSSSQVEEYIANEGTLTLEEGINKNLIKGTCKLENDLMVILNARELLKTIETK